MTSSACAWLSTAKRQNRRISRIVPPHPLIDSPPNRRDFRFLGWNFFHRKVSRKSLAPVIRLLAVQISMIAPTNPNAVIPQRILARRATDLSRRIYASLPWGYRVATLFTVLAADALDTFGRAMSAEMVLAAVRGMPDIGGVLATDWIQRVHQKGPDVLPPGTGREFAARVYKILLTRSGGDPEVAAEAMSAVLLASARRKIHIANGSSLHDAESYIITASMNAARDLLRARSRRREDSLARDRHDDDVEVDVEDPSAFERLDDVLPASELRKILNELGNVHPRAAEWLRARLEGQSGQEISEAWHTTPSYVSKWQRTYLPEIKKVVEQHLREARTVSRSAYDYRFIATSERTP